MKKILFLVAITLTLSVVAMELSENVKEFFASVERNAIQDVVDYWIAPRKVIIDTKNEDGNTALMIAVQKNYIQMVQELLRLHANMTIINKRGQTALTLAIDAGNAPMVTTLLDNGIIRGDIDRKDKEGNTALMHAIKTNNMNIIKAVLKELPNISLSNKNETATSIANKISDDNLKKLIFNLLEETKKQYDLYVKISESNPDISSLKALLNTIPKVMNTQNIDRNALYIALDTKKNLEIIKLLIAHGANVNQVFKNGKTPLILAIESKDIDAVGELLAAGANPSIKNSEGKTGLDIAQEEEARQKDQTIKKTYEQIVKIIQTTKLPPAIELFQAIEKGNIEKVKELVAAGVDILKKQVYNGELRSPLEFAVKIKHQEINRFLVDKLKLNFFKAAQENDIGEIKKLIPDIFNAQLAFSFSIKANNIAAIKIILNTFSKDVTIDYQDKKGDTPLIIAVETNNLDIIKAILDQVPNPFLSNKKNETAVNFTQSDEIRMLLENAQYQFKLYQAIKNKDLNEVTSIIDHININQFAKNKKITPLLFAVQQAAPEIVEFLLQNKADPNITTSDGTTPISWAKQRFDSAKNDAAKQNYEKIIKLLQDVITKSSRPSDDVGIIFSTLKNFTQKLTTLKKVL